MWRLRGLHTGGSGSQTGSGQTYLSPRVLGFQVGDRRARRVVLGTYDVIGTCTLDEMVAGHAPLMQLHLVCVPVTVLLVGP